MLRQQRRHLGAELGVRIDARANGGAALRQSGQPLHRVVEPLNRVLDLRAPAVEFLPHRDRHGVHQVGPAGLDDRVGLAGLFFEHAREVRERRQQALLDAERGADMNAGRNHVIAALAHVDVIVRMHLGAELFACERGDDFVGVHVGAGAAAGLKNVNRKMPVMLTGGHLERSFLDGHGRFRGQQAQLGIRAGRRPLNEAERGDKGPRHRYAGDRKIIDRALRLCAPQRIRGYFQFPHAVMHATKRFLAHICSISGRSRAGAPSAEWVAFRV